MNPSAHAAARAQAEAIDRLRDIPSVDSVLGRPALAAICVKVGRAVVTQAARTVLAEVRAELMDHTASRAATPDAETIEARIAAEVERWLAPSLRRVINATGVILHTNLGRAPLPRAAVAQIAETAASYSNLEYDVATGSRGRRDAHTARLLAEITGAEAAIVVNNNAAAVFLVLNTLAKGAEVIVSRGELIEIGDGFRIPEIMAESGAVLREVGTTNRTRLRDYERALNERTRLLLRVHPSNFRITGFTERPALEELVALGRRAGVPVFEDLGSGCVADLAVSGVVEPLVRESCAAGVSVVSFSGDKLLGGPQAGIIAGGQEIVGRIRRNPLFRALRVDKLVIAALESTLKAYLRGALDEIPALRMIRLSPDALARRAAGFVERMRPLLPKDATVEIRPGFSVIGGGSTPDQQLPTHLIAVTSRAHSAAVLEERLRLPAAAGLPAQADARTAVAAEPGPAGAVPVIARIEEDRVVLDLRTVFPDDEPSLAAALAAALG